jgi:hypothetical protein
MFSLRQLTARHARESPLHLEEEAHRENVPAALRGHGHHSSISPLKKELGISYHNGDYKVRTRRSGLMGLLVQLSTCRGVLTKPLVGNDNNKQIILRLIRVFNNGAEIKRRTDVAIDACSVMQNLRHAIKEYKVKTEES